MKLALFFFALFGLALAREKCPDIVPFDGTTTIETIPGYVLDFETAKGGVTVNFKFDVSANIPETGVLPAGTQFLFKIDRQGATAASVDADVTFSATNDFTGLTAAETGTIWGDAVYTIPNAVDGANPFVHVQLAVKCPACGKTAEFNVHTWLQKSGDVQQITLVADKRTATFETPKDGVVTFVHNFTKATDVYFDLTTPATETGSFVQVQYYDWETQELKGTFPTKKTTGSWLQEEPFEVAEGWAQFVFTVVNNTLGDVDWSVKAGFDELPCSSAFGLVSNIFLLALIPFTLFLNKF